METSSISELKKELSYANKEEIIAYCLRLAKFKKENKELLHYLLFEEERKELFVERVRSEMQALFATVHPSQVYLGKKTIRKILRLVNQYSKYAKDDAVSLSLLIFFCEEMQSIRLNYRTSEVLQNIFNNQLKKINTLLHKLHEDMQLDYISAIEKLNQDA